MSPSDAPYHAPSNEISHRVIQNMQHEMRIATNRLKGKFSSVQCDYSLLTSGHHLRRIHMCSGTLVAAFDIRMGITIVS